MNLLDPNYGLDPLQQSMDTFSRQQPQGGGFRSALAGMDPMMLMTLGSNILAANAQGSPTRLGPMGRIGMGMANAMPQIAGMQSLKEQSEERKQAREDLLAENKMKIAKEEAVAKRSMQMLAMYRKRLTEDDGVFSNEDQQKYDMAEYAASAGDNKNFIKLLAPEEDGIGFSGKGLEAQAVANILRGLPTDQREEAGLGFSRAIAERPRTIVTPEGTYTMPGIDVESVLRGPRPIAGRDGAQPSNFTPSKDVLDSQRQAEGVTNLLGPAFRSAINAQVFPSDDTGFMGRVAGGIGAQADVFSQNPEAPELIAFNDAMAATLSNIARIGGQTGVLTDPDVDRVTSMLPIPGKTPASLAKKKMLTIRRMLIGKGMTAEQLDQAGFPSEQDLAGGYSDLPR